MSEFQTLLSFRKFFSIASPLHEALLHSIDISKRTQNYLRLQQTRWIVLLRPANRCVMIWESKTKPLSSLPTTKLPKKRTHTEPKTKPCEPISGRTAPPMPDRLRFVDFRLRPARLPPAQKSQPAPKNALDTDFVLIYN